MLLMLIFFFFFKQKTAYEMRISDWSSDVCSSDLHWQVAQSSRTSQNLPENMDGLTLTEKKMKKHGHTTLAIRNACGSADIKVTTLNNLIGKLTQLSKKDLKILKQTHSDNRQIVYSW